MSTNRRTQHWIVFDFATRLPAHIKTNNKLELEEMIEHARALAEARYPTAITFTILCGFKEIVGPFPCR